MNKPTTIRDHPILVVRRLLAARGARPVFSYSRYEVAETGFQFAAPRSPVLRVGACDVTAAWLADRLAELHVREEMAWHSRVEVDGAGFHIPMIDFVSRPARSTLCKVSRMFVEEMRLRGDFFLFDTGRSFHGYWSDLIPGDAWPEYLDRLLIVNESNLGPVIDARWVGYASVRGFSALRWSHNTSRYRAMPHLVAIIHRAELG